MAPVAGIMGLTQHQINRNLIVVVRTAILSFLVVCSLVACSPEVGSEGWCEKMDEKPKGDWSANEASEYAKSCIFRSQE